MEKFDTSSKCLTYDFVGQSDTEMFVEQRSTLTGLSRLSFDNKAIYKGRLVVPKSSDPANMIVRFPLSKLLSQSEKHKRKTNRHSAFILFLQPLRHWVF